jgi:hypothetical protein
MMGRTVSGGWQICCMAGGTCAHHKFVFEECYENGKFSLKYLPLG